MPPLAETVPLADYEACPVTEVFRRFGDKWTLVTLMLLAERPHRFNELQRRIEGISQRMLTRTLRSLGADRLVGRTVHPPCRRRSSTRSPRPAGHCSDR